MSDNTKEIAVNAERISRLIFNLCNNSRNIKREIYVTLANHGEI